MRFQNYDENWETEFQKIENYLLHILTGFDIKVHHVGSTSVKGLGAKPIIDIDIEYQDGFMQIKDILSINGWTYEGEKGIKDRHAFRRSFHQFHEHHLYLIPSGGLELKKHISFRDVLRKYPILRNMYQEKKKQLVEANNKDRELYTDSKTSTINHIMKVSDRMKQIVFAGGCFWGVEAYFKLIEGVHNTEVGYIAGNGETSYQEVCKGSGHAEAVFIEYDPEQVTLTHLLDHLFNIIDPTSINKQGPDIGVQYRTGIYNYTGDELEIIQEYIKKRQPEYKRPIVLELKTDLPFYQAEDYHQDYLDKNKNGYCHVDLSSHKNV